MDPLSRCQIATPEAAVRLLWKMALERRPNLSAGRVLDLGAGDGRFALGGTYSEYVGLELDESKIARHHLPPRARVLRQDALEWADANFDLCIGNPPYVRHHSLSAEWRKVVLDRFSRECGLRIKQTANAFILFMAQALLRTKSDALVVQLVPFEWVTETKRSRVARLHRRAEVGSFRISIQGQPV